MSLFYITDEVTEAWRDKATELAIKVGSRAKTDLHLWTHRINIFSNIT